MATIGKEKERQKHQVASTTIWFSISNPWLCLSPTVVQIRRYGLKTKAEM